MDEPEFVEKADPEEVFAALSDDTRITILRALWDADEPLPFSDLREAVGVRDSGQFNYHLNKLVGQFVRQADGGYELTQASIRINGAIEAGAYTMEASFDPIDLDTLCPTCSGDRTLYYEDETVRVECESCPTNARFGVPPSVFADCDREAIPEVAGEYLRATFQHITGGFCPFCEGDVHPTVGAIADFLDDPDDPPEEVTEEFLEHVRGLPFVQYECDRCGATPSGSLRATLRSHPAVVSFHYDHGIDVRDLSALDFGGFNPDTELIRQRDPFRASVTFEADGDAITLVVDDALDVLDVERDRNS